MTTLNEDEMRALIRAHTSTYPTQVDAAVCLGVSKNSLNKMLQGERPCGKLVSAFGYRCTTKHQKGVVNHLYERVET